MIPVKLKLSNFTSYGEGVPELNFTKFHLAAISGQNGAGKSSLLDAITWCVWGTSRAGDNSDQLVRLGAQNMSVEFSFELDGHQFSVKRARSLKSGGSTALELWSGSHNLTEGTIKATQQKIINLLHLTFETFTNSSFLRQGHADEFTTKGPTDRKRILSDILGLSHYDELEEKAKEKAKDAQSKLSLLEYQLLEIEAELSQKEEREKSLSLAEEEARKIDIQIKEIEKQIKETEQIKQELMNQLKSLEEKKLQIANIQKEVLDIKLQIDLKEKATKEFQQILDQKEEIEKNYQKLQTLQEEKAKLDAKRSELIKIKDQWGEVQKILINREGKRTQAISLLEIEIKKFQTENAALEEQNKHLSEHKDTCPTCNQLIGLEKNKEIVTQNNKKISENNSNISELKQKIQKYKDIVLPEKKQAEDLEIQLKKIEQETKGWFELNQKISELEKFQNLYMKLQQAETGVKTHLETISDLKKMYIIKNTQIEEVEKELKLLASFENKLLEVKEELEGKERVKQELSQKALELQSMVGAAKQLVSRAVQLEDLYKKKSEEKSNLQKEKGSFEELALAFGKKGIQAMIIETAIPEIEDEANALLERLTEGRMKVHFETQRETKSKLADGEKGILETLDIIISDEMGERSYEAYSGGEQWRVNVAIRIALSKLLTRRAGAKLQFLVIDEGFGTQDQEGRSKIVEVLDTIKNDFEKILVITHLEELKEEFPVRIEVSKNVGGSTFEVVGT